MKLPRRVFAAPFVLVMASCGSSSKPPIHANPPGGSEPTDEVDRSALRES